MTSERRPDDPERQIGALARSLADITNTHGLRLDRLVANVAEIRERVLELEAHVSAVIAQTAETELTRRAVRELIGRVDALEDHEIPG